MGSPAVEAPMDLSLCELCEAIQSGRLTPVDTVNAALARIDRLNPAVNAFVFVCATQAREEAVRQTELLSAGRSEIGPLAGVPFGVKDLEDVMGLPTSYGAIPMRDNIATQDSVVVERLRAAGAIVVGKTNTPLFGSTAYCKNLLYGVTRNPWNLSKTPGGSSGGSSAAIAARMVPLATAADGGGSIRIPATYVGAFGFKPSFGRVPMTEGEQFGMTKWVDCVHFGPITRTVADAAVFMDMTVGYSPRDPNSLPHPGISYAETTAVAASTGTIPALATSKSQGISAGKLRVGWSPTLGYISAMDPAVLAACEAAVAVFRQKLGCTVVDLDLNLIDLGRDWGAAMGAQEYAMVHEELESTKDQLERGFVAGWERSAATNTDHFAKIYRKLHTLNEGLAAVFKEVDVLVTPALPTIAFDAAGPMPRGAGGKTFSNPMHAVGAMYPFNFSGHPAAVLRCPGDLTADEGLPPGSIQLVAERHRDDLILQVAAIFEASCPPLIWPEVEPVVPQTDGGSARL